METFLMAKNIRHKPNPSSVGRRRKVKDGQAFPGWICRTAAGVVFLSTTLATSWYFGWRDSFQQITVALVIVACLLGSWFWSRLGENRRKGALQDSILLSLWRGLLMGVLAVSLSGILLTGADYFPTYDRFLDRDRAEIEEQISLLSSAKNYHAATELVERRLSEPASDHWRQTLRQQQVDLLTRAGEHEADEQRQQETWQQAISIASQHDLDAEQARLRLKLLRQNQQYSQRTSRLEQELAQQQNQAITELARQPHAWLEQLVATENYASVDGLLGLQLAAGPKHKSRALHVRRLENLIVWGEQQANIDDRSKKFTAAIAYAEQHGLDSRLAKSRLVETRRDQAQRPRLLLPGSRGYITEQMQSADGSHRLVLYLEDASLQPIKGLAKKDFRLFQGERPLHEFDVTTLSPAAEQPTCVALLIDESPSTWLVQNEISQAVSSLLDGSPTQMRYRAFAFANQIHAKSGWTRDKKEIQKVLQTGSGGNVTALRRSIAETVEQLRLQPNRRILVLLTDGADTTGIEPSDQQLVRLCQASKVQVFCIGLESSQLDESLLQTLADATGGIYFKTEQIQELQGLFRHLHRSLSKHQYHVRIGRMDKVTEPLKLQIGRGDSALKISLNNAQPKGTKQELHKTQPK